MKIFVSEEKIRINKAKKLLENWGIEKEEIEKAQPQDIIACEEILSKLFQSDLKVTDIVDELLKLRLRISALEVKK